MTHPGCTQMLSQTHTAELRDGAAQARPGYELRDSTRSLRTRERQLGERRGGGLLQALRHPLRTGRAIRRAAAGAA